MLKQGPYCAGVPHPGQQVRTWRRNLDKLMNAGGPPGAAVHSVQEEYCGPAVYLAKMAEMQKAFENLNQEGSDFQ